MTDNANPTQEEKSWEEFKYLLLDATNTIELITLLSYWVLPPELHKDFVNVLNFLKSIKYNDIVSTK